MKIVKLSLLAFMAIGFQACQKDISSASSDTTDVASLAKGGGTTNPISINPSNADFAVTLEIVSNTCNEQVLKATSLNPGTNEPGNAGKTILHIYTDISQTNEIQPVSYEMDPEVIVTKNLAPGTYYLVGEFFLGGGNPPTTFRAKSETLPLIVATCQPTDEPVICTASGLVATSVTTYGTLDCSVPQTYKATFTATICNTSQVTNPIKIQGGLTNATTIASITGVQTFAPFKFETIAYTGYDVKYDVTSRTTGNGPSYNNISTWVFNVPTTAAHTYTQEFSVLFTKNKSTKSTDFATGSWSMKDARPYDGVSDPNTHNVIGSYTERLQFGSAGCN